MAIKGWNCLENILIQVNAKDWSQNEQELAAIVGYKLSPDLNRIKGGRASIKNLTPRSNLQLNTSIDLSFYQQLLHKFTFLGGVQSLVVRVRD